MNPKLYGIIMGLLIIVIAFFTGIFGALFLPSYKVIPILSVIIGIVGAGYLIFTIKQGRK